MSLERDKQSDLAVVVLDAVTVTEAIEYQGAAVDTFGFRNLTFVYWFGTDLADGDAITLGADDSPDNVTFTALAAGHLLPTRRQAAQTLVNPANGYQQTMGVFSADRYVRPTFDVTALESESIIINIGAIMIPELLDFTAWDPAVTGDGNP